MNRMVIAVALTCGLAVGSLAQFNADLQIKYDESKDATSVTTDRDMWLFGTSGDGLAIKAAGTYIGGTKTAASGVELKLLLFSTGTAWRFDPGDTSLIFLLDGDRRISIANAKQDYRGSMGDRHLEFFSVAITLENLREIANAKTVEGQIGSTDFALKADHQKILRRFVNYFEAVRH